MNETHKRMIGWWPIDNRMCKSRIKGCFSNFSVINVHSPHLDSDVDAFYMQLQVVTIILQLPKSHDVKIFMEDLEDRPYLRPVHLEIPTIPNHKSTTF